MGYRGYDRSGRDPQFCFGHGLGYTDWTYKSLMVGAETLDRNEDLALVVTVRNSGSRTGREVVQVYLEAPDGDPSRPLRTLAAFATAIAEPGERVDVQLRIPARAFARFDPDVRDWVWDPGAYTVHAGRSSRDLKLRARVQLEGGSPRS